MKWKEKKNKKGECKKRKGKLRCEQREGTRREMNYTDSLKESFQSATKVVLPAPFLAVISANRVVKPRLRRAKLLVLQCHPGVRACVRAYLPERSTLPQRNVKLVSKVNKL